MESQNKQFKIVYLLIVVLPLLFFILKGEYSNIMTKKKGVSVLVKYDSVLILPKRSYHYFSFYINNKKIITCNSGFYKTFDFNKITIKRNKFYEAKRNQDDPEVIIVNQDKEVTDTTLILQAGFSQKDIEKMLTED
jgi:hypothetical protein